MEPLDQSFNTPKTRRVSPSTVQLPATGDRSTAVVNAESIGWDGRFRGDLQEPGVYTYHAVLELSDGNVVVKEGSFVLMH